MCIAEVGYAYKRDYQNSTAIFISGLCVFQDKAFIKFRSGVQEVILFDTFLFHYYHSDSFHDAKASSG